MAPFAPTVREVVLLTGLLIFLLTFPTTVKKTSLTLQEVARLRTSHYFGGDDAEDSTPVAFEDKFSLQTLNAPLNWGMGQVPQTEIVAHVPGMCFCMLRTTTVDMSPAWWSSPCSRLARLDANELTQVGPCLIGYTSRMAPSMLSQTTQRRFHR